MAVARAADHAERRADNIIKAIAGVEKRIEALADETPHKVSLLACMAWSKYAGQWGSKDAIC